LYKRVIRSFWAIFSFILSFLATFYFGIDMKVDADLIFLVSVPLAFFILFLTYYSPGSIIGVGIFWLITYVGMSSNLSEVWLYPLAGVIGGIMALAIAFMWKYG